MRPSELQFFLQAIAGGMCWGEGTRAVIADGLRVLFEREPLLSRAREALSP